MTVVAAYVLIATVVTLGFANYELRRQPPHDRRDRAHVYATTAAVGALWPLAALVAMGVVVGGFARGLLAGVATLHNPGATPPNTEA